MSSHPLHQPRSTSGMVLVVLLFASFVLLTGYVAAPCGIKYTGLALALLCDLSFAWASRSYFQRQTQISPTQKRILRFTYITAIAHALVILYANHGSIYHFLWGAGGYIASLLLFWSAVIASRGSGLQLFFSARSPQALVTHGPYSEIRHPFYTAYTLAWISGMIMTDQPILILTVLGSIWTYHAAAKLEEAQFAQSPLAADYARYMQATGRFLPRLKLPSFAWFTPAAQPALDEDPDEPMPDRLTMWGPPTDPTPHPESPARLRNPRPQPLTQ